MRMNLTVIKKYFSAIAFILLMLYPGVPFTGCGQSGGPGTSPGVPDNGWDTASPTDVGMNEAMIMDSLDGLGRIPDNPLHSIVIVKDGKLVLERYYNGDDFRVNNGLQFVHKEFDSCTLHSLASASKSITSILVGIAIDRGEIADTDERLFSFFPEYSEFSDVRKEKITLEHLLTMSSGIPWDESYPYDDPRNDLTQMILYSPDPIGYVLEKELVAAPGEQFIYNSGTTNLLGEVIRRSTGVTLMEYADRYLFTPLGITSYEWGAFPVSPGMNVASSLLYLKPVDMAKIGQLYLQKGVWNGKRLVSESWAAKSTDRAIEVPPEGILIPGFNTSYGYQWWRGTFSTGGIDAYYAAGWGGQFIFVLPELNMVVVFTAGNYEGGYKGFYNMINDHILPAVNSLN